VLSAQAEPDRYCRSAISHESRLHRVKVVTVRQAFDGGDFIVGMHHRQRQAAIDALSCFRLRRCGSRSQERVQPSATFEPSILFKHPSRAYRRRGRSLA
jgi:hypothetical protein